MSQTVETKPLGLLPFEEVNEQVGETFGRIRLYRIFRISQNTNSFGLHGVWVMRRNGETWEIGISSFRLAGLKLYDIIKVPQMHLEGAQPCFAGFAEIPRRIKPDPPQEVIDKVWMGATYDYIKHI